MELSTEQQHEILQMAVAGYTLTEICKFARMDRSVLYQYRQNHPEFDTALARAQMEGVETQTDKLLTAHEDYRDPQTARVVSDNIKWIASRRKPEVYGDRLDLNVTERVDVTGALLEARKRSSMPICDQTEQDDTQVAEYWEVPAPGTTGCEPDDPPDLDDLLE